MGEAVQRAHVQALRGRLWSAVQGSEVSQRVRALWHLVGGREKAPAAICRKVLEAKLSRKKEIEIWGDGNQTRSFMYIDDCLKGVLAITEGELHEPINLGSNELVTINQLVDIVEEIAGIKLKRRYKLDAPKGVNGRNSDNAKILEYLGWEPSIRLIDGMRKTYDWIEKEMLTLAHA